MKSFLVIGLGRFGRQLAVKLSELGDEVMVIDKDEDRVNRLAGQVTAAQIGDCVDENVLSSLGVRNYDVCFVCIRDEFQSSLEVTSNLKELGAKYVVARAEREKQTKFLKIIGADEVIQTEADMAYRTAVRFTAKEIFEFVELSPQYAIFEIETPREWRNRTVEEVGVRNCFHVNIIGVKQNGIVTPLTRPDHVFGEGEHLVVAGSKDDVFKLNQ